MNTSHASSGHPARSSADIHHLLEIGDGGIKRQWDLDELVHELAASDAGIDTSGVEDPEARDDLRASWASNLNNQGYGDQIDYVLSQSAGPGLYPLLKDHAVSAHALLDLRRLLGA